MSVENESSCTDTVVFLFLLPLTCLHKEDSHLKAVPRHSITVTYLIGELDKTVSQQKHSCGSVIKHRLFFINARL